MKLLKKNGLKVLYLTGFIVVADQITKILVKGISIPFLNIHIEGMKYAQSIDVIGSFLKITYVENPGMAFGIDVGIESKIFLSLFSLAASVGILYYLIRVRDQKLLLRISLAMILGGAIGNLIDRTFYGIIYNYAPVFYGSVVDFLNVEFFDFSLFGKTYERWPIFNIADASVTIGVFLIIFFHRSIQQVEKTEDTPAGIMDADGKDNGQTVIEDEVGGKSASEESVSADQNDIELKNAEDDNRKEV